MCMPMNNMQLGTVSVQISWAKTDATVATSCRHKCATRCICQCAVTFTWCDVIGCPFIRTAPPKNVKTQRCNRTTSETSSLARQLVPFFIFLPFLSMSIHFSPKPEIRGILTLSWPWCASGHRAGGAGQRRSNFERRPVERRHGGHGGVHETCLVGTAGSGMSASNNQQQHWLF